MAITSNATAITFNDATVQTTAYVSAAAIIPAGTAMIFQQTAAPTGWTKVTSTDNAALRLVSGTASTGGTVAFTTAFASQAVSGTNSSGSVSATSLSTAQLASHSHGLGMYGDGGCNGLHPLVTGNANTYYGLCSGGAGSGGSHTHGFTNPTFTGTAINLAVKYVDVIIATKN